MIFQSDLYTVLKQCNRQVVYQNLDAFFPLFLAFCLLTFAPSDEAFGYASDPFGQSTQERSGAGSGAGGENDVRSLEPGKLYRRELAGGQRHTYRIRLAADQFQEAVIEQDGVDVVARLLGPDGEQVWGRIDPDMVFFQPPPGSEREALAIKAVLTEASVLLREQATETAIKRAKAPRVLHIATHGFFLGDQKAPPVETRSPNADDPPRLPMGRSKWAAKIENPLLRSGLAPAGANERRGGDDDGVLTAMEVASLDLWGTRLVTLSGCDTGVGEVRNGEGVYGLRRALALAGSETQVLSLWPVSDKETRNLMAGHYGRLLKGEGRGEALRQMRLGDAERCEAATPILLGKLHSGGRMGQS
jgi:hypothetical protein